MNDRTTNYEIIFNEMLEECKKLYEQKQFLTKYDYKQKEKEIIKKYKIKVKDYTKEFKMKFKDEKHKMNKNLKSFMKQAKEEIKKKTIN